jgi:tetratricopeptide (TPR) repeat protein
MSAFYNLSQFEKYTALNQWLETIEARIVQNFSGDLDCSYWIMPRRFSGDSDVEPEWGPIGFYYDASPGHGFAFELDWEKAVATFSESEFVSIVNQKNLNGKVGLLFREGHNAQKNGDYNLAIQKISEYAKLLPDGICHEPYFWLSKYFIHLDDMDSAVEHLKIYADGCGNLHAAKILKEVGLEFENKGFNQHAKALYLLAVDKNPNIGLTKIIKNMRI